MNNRRAHRRTSEANQTNAKWGQEEEKLLFAQKSLPVLSRTAACCRRCLSGVS